MEGGEIGLKKMKRTIYREIKKRNRRYIHFKKEKQEEKGLFLKEKNMRITETKEGVRIGQKKKKNEYIGR